MYDESDDDLRHQRPNHQGHDFGAGTSGLSDLPGVHCWAIVGDVETRN